MSIVQYFGARAFPLPLVWPERNRYRMSTVEGLCIYRTPT